MKKRRLTRRGGIQKIHLPLVYKLSCEITIAANQCVDTPAQDKSTERKKAIASLLRQDMRATSRLVQALQTNTPMSQRKYDTRLVDCLLYQTENLLSTFERYVFPILEQRDNKKNHFHKAFIFD